MAVTASATLSTTGSLAAPKLGDVLDYRVTILGSGRTVTISPPTTGTTNAGVSITVTGGPWILTLPDAQTIPAPLVTGVLSKPFTQDPADPRHWSATL